MPLTQLTGFSLDYFVININPIALQIGKISIHWYGIAYVAAIAVGLLAILRYADSLGVSREYIWRLFIWTAIAGLVGGRLYYVIQQPNLLTGYIEKPINIIAVWNGGMAYFGAIFLATPTIMYFSHKYGLSPWLALDIGGLFGAVGQMFGRFGNLVNGDIVGYPVARVYAPPTVCVHAPCIAYVANSHVLPWATAYINAGSFIQQLGIPYQPAAAYEMIINLIALAILWPLRLILPKHIKAGAFFCLYVAMYSIGQFIIFFARSNIFVSFLGIDTLKQAQWTGIITLIAIALFYWYVVRRFSHTWQYNHTQPMPTPFMDNATGKSTTM